MSSASDSSARKAEVLETAITQSPALERAFYEARGICEKFRQSHPSKRLCKKGADCPFLHCSKEQDYHLATNRLRAPFRAFVTDGRVAGDTAIHGSVALLVDQGDEVQCELFSSCVC